MRPMFIVRVLCAGLALAGCHDFDREYALYCERFGCEGDPNELIIAAEPVQIGAGECGPVRFRVRRRSGEPPTLQAEAEITFPQVTGRATQPTLSTSALCDVPVSSLSLTAGEDSVSLNLVDQTSGSYQLPVRVHYPSLNRSVEGAVDVEILRAQPVRLHFASAPDAGRVGQCVGPFDARLVDPFGNESAVTDDLPISLTHNSPAAYFSREPLCGTAFVDAGIESGGSSLSFYFKDTRAGARQIRATPQGLQDGLALQVVQILTAPPASVELETAPPNVLATDCSAPFDVRFSDAFGNRVPLETDGDLGLTSSVGLTFFADGSCQTQVSKLPLTAGATSATFHARKATPSATGTLTVSFPQLVSKIHPFQVLSPGTPLLDVSAGSPTPFVAGDCNLLRISSALVDGGSYAVDGLPVTLTAPFNNDAGFYAFNDSSCAGPPIQSAAFPAGQQTFQVRYADRVAGNSRSVVASGADFVSDSLALQIQPAPLGQIGFINPPATVEAGICTPVQVRAFDVFGNATTDTGSTTVSGFTSLLSEVVTATAGCPVSPVTNASFSSGAATLFWSAQQSGAVPGATSNFTASAGVFQASTVVQVVPGPPVRGVMAPASYPASSSPGDCYGPDLAIRLEDRFGANTTARSQLKFGVAFTKQSGGVCSSPTGPFPGRLSEGNTCSGTPSTDGVVFNPGDAVSFYRVRLSSFSANCTFNILCPTVPAMMSCILPSPATLQVSCKGPGRTCNAGQNAECCSNSCVGTTCG